ncbi:MAG: Prostatic spermine-binding protein precursor [Phaeospirillum sp.]|nr:Prostatic spermine-binding protein precursor [Phaeospirillum sp.]
MKKLLLAAVSALALLSGAAFAADDAGLGTVLKDAATQAVGQAAKDTIDKTVKTPTDRDSRDKDRDYRDKDRDRRDKDRDRRDKDRDYRDRDRRDAPGNSYEHRRDGRGRDDNPGRGRNRD